MELDYCLQAPSGVKTKLSRLMLSGGGILSKFSESLKPKTNMSKIITIDIMAIFEDIYFT
jgi:hypothetical protein